MGNKSRKIATTVTFGSLLFFSFSVRVLIRDSNLWHISIRVGLKLPKIQILRLKISPYSILSNPVQIFSVFLGFAV